MPLLRGEFLNAISRYKHLMTRFLDVEALGQLVREIGLESFLIQLSDAIRDDFKRWEQFQKSPRVANHVPGGVLELMPTADESLYGFKYVNGHPKNCHRNLLTVMSFGMLAEVQTGVPVLLSEMTVATALRTAATSAVAAQVLARPNSRTMAIIGAGAQSEFQAMAFKVLLGVDEIRIFDIDGKATEKFLNNLNDTSGLKLVAADSVSDAVKGADIVTTATADKTNAIILSPEMIEPGMHINGVGGDCPGKTEIHPQILRDAKVVVEFEPQTRIEGEIQQVNSDYPVTELWRILCGTTPGRESESQVTIFDSVGFAIEDFSMLRLLRTLAETLDVGQMIDLIPTPANPRDLFQFVR